MKVLLDTQCWLWWFAAPERLNKRARGLIADGSNTVLLSAASCWEMAIKCGLGKLTLPEPMEHFVPSRLASQGMEALPVTVAHALRVASLPPIHRDPFDRLLVAQAQLEELSLLTADRQIAAYDVRLILAS